MWSGLNTMIVCDAQHGRYRRREVRCPIGGRSGGSLYSRFMADMTLELYSSIYNEAR